MDILSTQRIVIKIGSSLLVDEATQAVHQAWLESLLDDVVMLVGHGIQVILVSSGAVALGALQLRQKKSGLSLDRRQAASAVGQIQLSRLYDTLLGQRGLIAAQVLLTLGDTENRTRFINLRNTVKQLLTMKLVPVINENDSVATSEIRYGDNDRLAARVAQMMGADLLILLSDVDGLYSSDPHLDPNATFIEEVPLLSSKIIAMAGGVSSQHGSGGMITKLEAAKIATRSGCHMLITQGHVTHPIQHYLSQQRGTWFHAEMNPKRAKKHWLQQHLQPSGTVNVDQGAKQALLQGASLLAVGIVGFSGKFHKGELVAIVDHEQQEIARGLMNYSHSELRLIMGKKTDNIPSILGYVGCDEVIHRDNLVLT